MAPTKTRPRRLAAFRRMTLPHDSDLWRGTSDLDDWTIEGQGGWFTDSAHAAASWAALSTPRRPWVVGWFNVRAPVELVALATFKDLDRLGRALGAHTDGDEFHPTEVAEAACAAGLNGWYIEEGDNEGADVFLCDPTRWLEFIRIADQSDDWDEPGARRNNPRATPPPGIPQERVRWARRDSLEHPPGTRPVDLATEVFAAAVRRIYGRHAAQLDPVIARAPVAARKTPRALITWVNRQAHGVFDAALAGTAGRPRRPRAVAAVQSLDALPKLVWHGTTKLDGLLLDGLRLPPGADMGYKGKRGWGWDSGSFRWGGLAWEWFESLTWNGRVSLEEQVGASISTREELGRHVSLLFVMTADPIYASHYTGRNDDGVRGYGPVVEFDTRRLPVFGFFEDPYVMGRPLVLVLPARGYQGGPDAVVALREPS